MQAGHILLGRPWQYDRRANHDGFTNRYTFTYEGKNVVLNPLSPLEVYEDQKRQLEKAKQEASKVVVYTSTSSQKGREREDDKEVSERKMGKEANTKESKKKNAS